MVAREKGEKLKVVGWVWLENERSRTVVLMRIWVYSSHAVEAVQAVEPSSDSSFLAPAGCVLSF